MKTHRFREITRRAVLPVMIAALTVCLALLTLSACVNSPPNGELTGTDSPASQVSETDKGTLDESDAGTDVNADSSATADPDDSASEPAADTADSQIPVASSDTDAQTDTDTDAQADTDADTAGGTAKAPDTDADTAAGPEPGTDAPTETGPDTAPDTQEVMTLEDPSAKPFDPSTVTAAEMPCLYIVTDNGHSIHGSNTDQPVYHCTVSMSNCPEEYAFSNEGADVRVRGNSTATAGKKPLKLKFDVKRGMLGLNDGNSFRTWVLLADLFDETMLRNYSAFTFGSVLLDNKWYCSDCAHVEVYINGNYQGVYLLCEQTQIKKNRVNIASKEKEDKTTTQTGYLLIGQGGIPWGGNYFDVPIGFDVVDKNGKTGHYGSIRFVLSGDDDYSAEQRQYISDYLSAAFKVIKCALYDNEYYTLGRNCKLTLNARLAKNKDMTEAEKQIATISAVMDLDAAARMCVLDELCKNLDAMTFNIAVDLSPEGDGRIVLMAPWDYDHAMAKTKYDTTHSTSGWYATNLSVSDGTRVNFLFVMLGRYQWFDDMMAQVWKDHYPAIKASVNAILTESYRYEAAFTRDWQLWGGSNRPQTGHQAQDMYSFTCHADSAEFLAKWLNARIKWLNRQWGDEPDDGTGATDFVLDLTKAGNMAYFSEFRRCRAEITDKGMLVSLDEARDPHFYLDLTGLEEQLSADDYPVFEITCMVPKGNSLERYGGELFLCCGSRINAEGGFSTTYTYEKTDGVYHTYTVDLSAIPFWNDGINKIRIDYFNDVNQGDIIYIKSVALRTSGK